MVVNVHTNCLKGIGELNFSSVGSVVSSEAAKKKDVTKNISSIQDSKISAGQKRTYVDVTQQQNLEGGIEESKGGDHQQKDDAQLRGLQDIIKGLESQKRRKTSSDNKQ